MKAPPDEVAHQEAERELEPLEVPLPLRWRTRMSGFSHRRAAPIPVDGGVIVRHGQRVARVRANDGKTVWEHAFPPSSLGGDVLLRAGELVITEAKHVGGHAHSQKQAYAITAVRIADGVPAWSVDVIGQLLDGQITLDGDVLRVQTLKARQWRVTEIDVRTGVAEKPRKIERGLSDIVRTLAGLVGRSHTAKIGRGPGYTAYGEGELRSIELPAVWELRAVGDSLVCIALEIGKNVGRVDVRDARTLEVRWTAPVTGRLGDADDDAVVTFEAGHVVLRALADGSLRWRHRCADAEPGLRLAGPYVAVQAWDVGALLRREDGRSLGTLDCDGPMLVSGDAVYVRTSDSIAAFELERAGTKAPRAATAKKKVAATAKKKVAATATKKVAATAKKKVAATAKKKKVGAARPATKKRLSKPAVR